MTATGETCGARTGRRSGLGSGRADAAARRARQREDRWRNQRFAVPYPVDGPKVSLGVAWFLALVVPAQFAPRLVVVVVVPVAVLAALQTGHAWSHQELSDKRVAASVAGAVTISAWFGALGLGVATLAGVAVLGLSSFLSAGSVLSTQVRLTEILVRTALPVAVAAGALFVLATEATSAFVSLVLLVSAYEVGDFVVGTGSANAIEGPIAGLAALCLVGVGLYLILPDPFTNLTMPIFAGIAGVCAPLGQLAGSAVLPRGDAWAPALRRLDSYLVSAPLWLLLV